MTLGKPGLHGEMARLRASVRAPETETWCRLPVSNWGPSAYKAGALPTELSRRARALPTMQRRAGKVYKASEASNVAYLTRLSAGRPPAGGSGGGSPSEDAG